MKRWQEFSGQVSGPLARENFICSADELGLILVRGHDAADFLQNQLSNDIYRLDESRFQLSSYSTPKGRMLGVFRVIRVSNGYLLVTARAIVLPLLERLYHYILRADVALADATDYFARIALQTDQPEVIGHASLAPEPGSVFQDEKIVSLQLEPLGSQRRYLVFSLDADAAIALWQALAEHLAVTGFASWRLAEIHAGVPTIYPATAEEFVPQMANLGALDGINFNKGCYPGQEIVARMQYLGKLKRRMYLAELDAPDLPRPGDDLVVAGKSEIDGSGKVVDAEFDGDGRCLMLYIAQIPRAESGDLELLRQPGVAIRNLDLPYSLPA